MPIYLLHFDHPYKHAKHYIGFVEEFEHIEERLKQHAKGQGSRLMEVVSGAGITFTLARVWKVGDRNFERLLKNKKNTPRLCPICNRQIKKTKVPHFESERYIHAACIR